MSTSIVNLKVGETAIITGMQTAKSAIGQRLLDMGITRGTHLLVERVAPLGDPIQIYVKNYHLALRKEEAEDIHVERTAEQTETT